MARDDAGVAAIEFAVYATVFLMITAATVDIGLLLFTQSELDAAVGAGAQFAAHGDATAASIAAIVDNANGAGWASSTVSVNNSDATGCYCPTGSPGSWSWGSTGSYGAQCPSGNGVYGQFVTITASRSVSPIFSAFGFVQAGTISRSALVETQ